MRFLKLFFRIFIIVSIILVGLFFISREALLYIGLTRVRSLANNMERLAINSRYKYECMQQAGLLEEIDKNVIQTQLRFENNKEFVSESVCTLMRDQVKQHQSSKLPVFVNKIAGFSGISLNYENSGVVLSIFGRKAYVSWQDNKAEIKLIVPSDFEAGQGPIAQCSNYGFSCCEQDTHQGIGDQLQGVTDCPNNCFNTCSRRPMVLSFNTDPFFQDRTRTINVKPNQLVTFSFVTSSGSQTDFSKEESSWVSFINSLLEKKVENKQEYQVILNFGNDKQESFNSLDGTTQTSFDCLRGSCFFTASLKVINEYGITNSASPLSEINIVVER